MTSHDPKTLGLTKVGAAFVLALALLGPASAAEVGDLSVFSFVGQPLVAEIELNAITPEEADTLSAKLASIDVYRQANLQIKPELGALRFAVRRRDKRQYIRVTSDKPIYASYLHLYLELTANKNHMVRAFTIWLEPAPRLSENSNQSEESDSPSAVAASSASAPSMGEADEVSTGVVPVAATTILTPPHQPEPRQRHHAQAIARHPIANKKSCDKNAKTQFSDEQIKQCMINERENRRISFQITDLEQKVTNLRDAVTGNPDLAQAASVARPAQMEKSKIAESHSIIDKPWKASVLTAVTIFGAMFGAYLAYFVRFKKVKLLVLMKILSPRRLLSSIKAFPRFTLPSKLPRLTLPATFNPLTALRGGFAKIGESIMKLFRRKKAQTSEAPKEPQLG